MPRLRPCEPRIEWKWRNLHRSATQPTVGFRLPCPSCAPPSAPSEGVFVAAPAPPSRGTGGRGLFDELLEAEDVARWAGVDTGTAYRWASEGTGPRRMKLGGLDNGPVRFRRGDVLAWLEERAIAPAKPAPRARRSRRAGFVVVPARPQAASEVTR